MTDAEVGPIEWKPVITPGFEGLYEASSIGQIRERSTGKILDISFNPNTRERSYPRVRFSSDDDITKWKPVHIMVLEAFSGPRPPGHYALHRDDDAANNAITNLYWGTRLDNAKDSHRNKPRSFAHARWKARMAKTASDNKSPANLIVGRNIRAEMGRQRISMTEMSRRTGIRRATLIGCIDHSGLTVNHLYKIAEALDVPTSQLFPSDGEGVA